MSENSAIEWTDHTFNTHWGCSEISPGCDNCYAKRLAARFGYGWGDDAEKRRFGEKHWDDLLAWDRKAAAEGVRRNVFTNSMSDLFDKFAPEGVREHHWEFIARTSNLNHLLLTKRIGNVRRMMPLVWLDRWPSNVRIGSSIVNQPEADRDLDKLVTLSCPNFVSCEPLLGPLDLTRWLPLLDWVIAGGESGPHARPAHPDWFRSLRDQCAAAGVAFHFKQWGEWRPAIEGETFDTTMGRAQRVPAFILSRAGTVRCFENDRTATDGSATLRVGKRAAGRLLDGVEHDGFPV